MKDLCKICDTETYPYLFWNIWIALINNHISARDEMWRGLRGGSKTKRQRDIWGWKREKKNEGRKLKMKHLKEEKEGKSSNRDREIFSGSQWRQWGGWLDKYTPLHWMTGILISHLPPGETERAEQGWTCHLNLSSLLILHYYPSLHPSACSFFHLSWGLPS